MSNPFYVLEKEYWRKHRAGELPTILYEQQRKANEQWVLKTPFGPMVHRETGKSYWATQVELEHDHAANV
jgi:hypothetical protein